MGNEAALQEKQIEMAKELLFSGEQLPSFAQGLFIGQFDHAGDFVRIEAFDVAMLAGRE